MGQLSLSKEIEMVDPVALVEKAIAADLDAAVLTEETFDLAPNVIEWCMGSQFLNSSLKLWPRQIQILTKLFEDVCYFCSDVEYIHDVAVDDYYDDAIDRFQLLEHGICPKCQRNRLEILDDWSKDSRYAHYNAHWDLPQGVNYPTAPPNEFVGIWGQRCSKSFGTASFIWTYHLHRYLNIPNITRYFNMPSNTVLEAAFVAPILDQVNVYMWQPFVNAYDESPWFRQVEKYWQDESRRVGKPLYHRQQTFITFPAKRLAIYMKAANSGTLRGGTRFFSTCDELGWFNVSEDGKRRAGVKDGAEVFTSLNRSLRTIRTKANKRRRAGDYNSVDGLMVCISSPSSVNDPIEQRAALAPKSPRMYHTRFATWEVNPDEDEQTLREEEGADPIKFLRDYGAQAPRAAVPFIEDSPFLADLVEKKQTDQPLFTYDITAVRDEESGRVLLRPRLTSRSNNLVIPRVLAVDNGEKKNSFALAIARYFPEHDGLLLEEFLEVAPGTSQSIDLAWCYNELVLPLVQQFRFLHVCYDRWESAYAVSDLRMNHGIDAQRYSLKWSDFVAFRDDVRASRIWFPQPETDPAELVKVTSQIERARTPRAHFTVQMTTVNEFGRKVVKPDGGTDDLFRCGVLAHWCITNHKKDYQTLARGSRERRPGEVAMVFHRGNNVGGGGYRRGGGGGAGPRRAGRGIPSGFNR